MVCLDDVLCIQEDRRVGGDNCISWSGKSWQKPEQKHCYHYVRATVWEHEYPDGWLAMFEGPRCLARYNANGGLLASQLPVDRETDPEGFAEECKAARELFCSMHPRCPTPTPRATNSPPGPTPSSSTRQPQDTAKEARRNPVPPATTPTPLPAHALASATT